MKKLILLTLSPCLVLPTATRAADILPEGVMSVSPYGMPWEDAQKYCEAQGGSLPLFAGKKRVTSPSGDTQGKPAELFGFADEEWQTGLPLEIYWLGTEHSKRTAWNVFEARSKVVITFSSKNAKHRALCLSPPK